MRHTRSIKTVLRPDKIKADKTIPVHYSVRVGPTTTRIPTGKSVLLSDWDVKTSSPKKNNSHNQALGEYFASRINAWNIYLLQQETMGKQITLTVATAFFKTNAQVTFFKFFQEQIELWETSKAPNTIKSYRSTLNVLKAFNSKLNFGDLTYDTIERFDVYMSKKRGNATGGKFTKHKCLKSIIRQAILKGHMTSEQYPYRGFTIKATVGKRSFLTVSEVTQIMNLEIPEKESYLNKVRDLFVFGCLTGLRYSDVMNLKWSNIDTKKNTITAEMTKTQKQVMIPLLPQALDILNNYGRHTIKVPTSKALPQMTNQALNRDLKILMQKAGIDKPISYHCARHSFATNLIEARTNILTVRDLLGHSQLRETQIYAKTLMSDLHSSMENLGALYGKAI